VIRHRELRLLAAGAALEDLDPAEAATFDRHRAGCGGCASLIHDLDAILADLALIANPLSPPSALQREVLEAIRASEPPVA
jgi:hypothetical protein